MTTLSLAEDVMSGLYLRLRPSLDVLIYIVGEHDRGSLFREI